MKPTHADIARHFDGGTLQRGKAYARDGMVRSVRRDGDRIHGEVNGSGRNVYRQTIRLLDAPGKVRIEGDCSCPMSRNCKHVVAVLLAGGLVDDTPVPAVEPAPRPAPPAADEWWLQHAARLHASVRAAQAGPAAPQRPPATQHRLIHVLVPAGPGRSARLHLCKARLRKAGDVAAAKIHDDPLGLLASPPAWVAPDDEAAVRLVAALGAGKGRLDGVEPAGELGARLLERLCADKRLFWAGNEADLTHGRLVPVRSGPRRRALLEWCAPYPGSTALVLTWLFDDGHALLDFLPTDPVCYLSEGEDGFLLGALDLPPELGGLAPAALAQMVVQAPVLEPEQRTGLATRMAGLGLDGILPLPQALETRVRRDVAPTPSLVLDSFLDYRHGRTQWHDHARLSFEYDGMPVEDGEPVLRRVHGNTVEVIERDLRAERAAAGRLARSGFTRPDGASPLARGRGILVLPAEADWIAFARTGVPRLREAGWQIEFDANYRYDFAEVEDWTAELSEEVEDGNPWFSLELGIIVEGKRHSLLPLLLEAIRRAPRDFTPAALAVRDDDDVLVVEVPPSTRVALPWGRIKPILAALGELYFGERIGDALRLPALDAARLAELERAARLRWMGGERLRELGRRLDGFDGIHAVAPPAGLCATLRPYQQAGLAWMQFLREYGFGGILADDMGLGKTVQTLAHVLAEKEAGRLDAPALVVAPTTLMGNWQAEAARFAPGLRVLTLHGKDRKEAFARIGEADLVLTTYALLGRDEALLRAQRYHLLILDEAQYIKNSRAKAAQAACLLDARHRLCLTGTPVQNHLGELWSQFHFLMPGLLGDEKTFQRRYRKPIEQQGDVQRQALLARRVKPFMLRRTKDKVATELPPKTDIVLRVELSGAQRDLYETVRLAMDRKVRAAVDSRGLAASQIVILDALLKLRQVCCDPRLVKQDAAVTAGSAKLEALMALLDTLTSEGRKVLVFSQFTSMLALIEAELDARGVGYALLTGDTQDRAAPVADFQQGRVDVFLISLKAGGVGLNLTTADTVIHYDPWWNPASENQATDRAWRIGQDKPVFVYKLIAQGTLEEKIQDMQRRKGALADALLSAEGGLAAGLGADDLRAIFGELPG